MSSTEIAVRDSAALALAGPPTPDELETYIKLANTICVAEGFVPRNYLNQGPATLACLLKGRELGLGPMTSLGAIHVIEGKPSLSAELMLAKLRAGGVKILESESTADRAWIKAERDGEVMAAEWTFEEASKITYRKKDGTQGLLVQKDNWRNYRADMLWSRCVGRLGRRIGPDLLLGVTVSTEELRDLRDAGPDTIGYDEPTDDGTHPPARPVLIRDEKPPTAQQEPHQDAGTHEGGAEAGRFDMSGYDALSAGEIKLKLPEIAQRPRGQELLAYIRQHEAQTKGRKTILDLIARLLNDEPLDEPEDGTPAAAEPTATPKPEPEPPPAEPTPAEAPTGERIRFVSPDGETVTVRALEDGPPDLMALAGLGLRLPDIPKVPGAPPMWSEPDELGIRTIQLERIPRSPSEAEAASLLRALAPEGDPDPEEEQEQALEPRPAEVRLVAALDAMSEAYGDALDEAWTLPGILRMAGEAFRGDAAAIATTEGLTDEELGKLLDVIPAEHLPA